MPPLRAIVGDQEFEALVHVCIAMRRPTHRRKRGQIELERIDRRLHR